MRIQRQPRFATAPYQAPSAPRQQLPRRIASRGLRRKAYGFSLVELMVVVSLGAILLGIGTASFRYVTNANRVSTEVNSLLGDLMLARSEAIKQAAPVITCPVTTTGAVGCAGTSNWQYGWIVFVDADSNGSYSSGDTIIRQQKAFSVTTDTFTSDTTVQSVTYNREGFAVGLPTTNALVTLHTSPANAQWTRCLQISTFGNLTTQRANAASTNCK